MSKAAKLLAEISPGFRKDILYDLISKVESLFNILDVLDTKRATIHLMLDELDMLKAKEGKDFAKADDLLNKATVAYGRLLISLKKAKV